MTAVSDLSEEGKLTITTGIMHTVIKQTWADCIYRRLDPIERVEP